MIARNSTISFTKRQSQSTSTQRISSLLDNTELQQPEWHSPTFMANETPEAKDDWLDHLLLSSKSGTPSSFVDATAYLHVLRGWSKSRGKAAAPFKAEDWIVRLERHYEEEGRPERLRPTVDHYNAVIEAWASSQEAVSIVRAERWLNKLRDGLSIGGTDAIGKENNDNAAASVTNNDYATTTALLLPNIESYNLFLDACSKGHGKSNDILRNNAIKAEDTLKEMMEMQEERNGDGTNISPNTDSFNYVIRAWTRCRTDITMADKVMNVLRTMELYQRTGHDDVKANTISYCMAIDAWGTVAGIKSQGSLKRLKKQKTAKETISSHDTTPDNADFGTEELSKAESILDYMHNLYDSGDTDVMPTTDAYNTYVNAFTRTANEVNTKSPLAAEKVLRKMTAFHNDGLLDIQPDQRSYIHVMRAWGKVKRKNSGERAEWWLRNMWSEFEETGNTNVKPNVGAYLAVMEAYFHQSNAAKLESLLLELLEYENSGEDATLHANTAAFTFIIRGWLKHEDACTESDMGVGCDNALKWLDRLIDREEKGLPYASTSPELFTGIIKGGKTSAMSIHTTRVSKKVFKTVLEAFTEFRASRHIIEPNAYAWVLQVGLKALSSPTDSGGRTKLIRHLSKACIDDGFVSKSFVAALSNGPIWTKGWTADESKKMTMEVFGDWPLPKSWSRNVKRAGDLPSRVDMRRTRVQPEDWHVTRTEAEGLSQKR